MQYEIEWTDQDGKVVKPGSECRFNVSPTGTIPSCEFETSDQLDDYRDSDGNLVPKLYTAKLYAVGSDGLAIISLWLRTPSLLTPTRSSLTPPILLLTPSTTRPAPSVSPSPPSPMRTTPPTQIPVCPRASSSSLKPRLTLTGQHCPTVPNSPVERATLPGPPSTPIALSPSPSPREQTTGDTISSVITVTYPDDTTDKVPVSVGVT